MGSITKYIKIKGKKQKNTCLFLITIFFIDF